MSLAGDTCRVNKVSETDRTMKCPKCGAENYSWHSRCQMCGILLHEDEVSTVKYHRRDYLQWSALTTGLIGAGTVALFMWFIFAFAWGRITEPIGWAFVLGTGLLALGSVAIAWKWPLIGGVLLTVDGLVLIGLYVGVNVWTGIQSGFGPFLFGLLFFIIPSLPLLASGILFILSWRKGQRASAGSTPSEGERRNYGD